MVETQTKTLREYSPERLQKFLGLINPAVLEWERHNVPRADAYALIPKEYNERKKISEDDVLNFRIVLGKIETIDDFLKAEGMFTPRKYMTSVNVYKPAPKEEPAQRRKPEDWEEQ